MLINTNQPNIISMGAKTKIKRPDYAEMTDTGVLIELLSGVSNQSL